jgi:hypothetical protein
MPRRVYPGWKWDVTLSLIVKDNASLCMEQKPIIRDSECRADLTASVAVIAVFHHLCFSPVIFPARQVGVESY